MAELMSAVVEPSFVEYVIQESLEKPKLPKWTNMKRILIALLVLFICGCGSQPSTQNVPEIKGVYSSWDKLIIVDGCQYAICRTHNAWDVYVHLGTCTNCWAKMEKLIGKKLNVEKE